MAYENEAPIGFGEREYEIIPAGYYDAQIVGVYNVGAHFDNYYQKYNTVIKVKYEINYKGKNDKKMVVLQDYNATMGAKAKLRAVAHACVGRDITDQEAAAWRLSDFVGKQVMLNLSVVPLKSDPSKTRNKVMAIIPARLPAYEAEAAKEFWDYRISDPDDAPNWIWDSYCESRDFKPPAKPRTPKPRTPLGESVAEKPRESTPSEWGAPQPPADNKEFWGEPVAPTHYIPPPNQPEEPKYPWE